MNFRRFAVLSCLLLATPAARAQTGSAQEGRVLDPKIHHLGDSTLQTWPAGTPEPESLHLRVAFRAQPSDVEQCLVIKHFHVDDAWPILVNGRSIGNLVKGKVFEDHAYFIPPGFLKAGENELLFKSNRTTDDILIGAIRLVPKTRREYFNLRKVEVAVTDDRGQPIPARITIATADGKDLVPVYYAEHTHRAVRQGVVYSANGVAAFEVPEGRYIVYASRGMEWGVDERAITVDATPRPAIALRIAREVDTRGYVSSDSHIHTLTFSGHGDASTEERMVTLAGEGVELAISTDHNHQTDYRPYQEKLGLHEHFTSVVGNEVTSQNGHFNAFPLDPNKKVPPSKIKDWVKLVGGIRAAGAKVVILNHPRWPQLMTNSPFGKAHFELNRLTGKRRTGPEFTFDAMELVNATVQARDPLFNFVDWFALLNHGERIMAVGTSDSHTVGDPVGQGRTYLRSGTDDPTLIDVDEACDSYRLGRSSISHGLFAEVTVDGTGSMGSTVPVRKRRIEVALRVASAAWARPDRVRLFLNGRLAHDAPIETEAGKPTDQTIPVTLQTPAHDAHLVCIVTGPGVQGRFWRAKSTNNYVLAATNPVFLDVDRDGRYLSPRSLARRLVRRSGMNADRLAASLAEVDDAVLVQAATELHEGLLALAGTRTDARAAALATVKGMLAQFAGRPQIVTFAGQLENPALPAAPTDPKAAGDRAKKKKK